MKQLLLFTISATFYCTAAAQIKMETKADTIEHNVAFVKDYVLMKNGKMEVVKAGKHRPLLQPMKMPNGVVVSTNGIIKMVSGKKIQLKEGEFIDMNGRIEKEK